MRITSYRVTPIATIDPPLRAASGLHASFALRVILEIACEDGITGFSEIPCTNGVVESLNHICKHLLGEDPLQLTRLLEKAKASLVSLKREDEARGDTPWDQRIWVHARSALEVACLDYLGKRFEVRVCDLLGGAVREAVPFGTCLFYQEPGAGGDLTIGTTGNALGMCMSDIITRKAEDKVNLAYPYTNVLTFGAPLGREDSDDRRQRSQVDPDGP